jgi:hypothetical protein
MMTQQQMQEKAAETISEQLAGLKTLKAKKIDWDKFQAEVAKYKG